MRNMPEVGQVVGGAAVAATRVNWVIVDGASGKEKRMDHTNEPTEGDLKRFKDSLGYSSVKIIRKDAACKTMTVQPVDKAGMVEVGEIIDGDDEKWTIIDEVSGAEETYDEEPDEDDIIAFKDEQGYSSVKIVSKVGRRITIRPVDKAGQE
jgi:hypothetical protein